MTRILRWTALAVLVALPMLALGQDVPPPAADLDPMVLLKAFVDAIQHGQWPVVAVVVLVALTWVLRKVGTKWIPWLGTSEGGSVLALLTAVAATLGAAALVPGATITWPLVGSAIAASFAAAGGWTLVRRLLRLLVPVTAKWPWLQSALSWLSGADTAARVEAKAAAGFVPVPAGMTPQQAAEILAKPPAA